MQPVVDTSCLYRTFLIKFGDSFGSAFAIDVDGRQYLLTAKHVATGINSGDALQIIGAENHYQTTADVVFCSPEDVDIVVLALPNVIVRGDAVEPTMRNITLGQEIYFLGFPFTWRSNTRVENNPFPLPFVKHGVLSALYKDDSEGVVTLYLDAQSNPGFSGGPVIFWDHTENVRKIAGVIHGQVATEDPVSDESGETDFHIAADAGLVKASGIQPALDAIAENPIGCPLNR